MDMREKQLFTVERDTMRHADVTYVAAGARGIDRLHHRFLRADTLQDRISADSFCYFLNAFDSAFASLCHDVGRSKFACELLARRMTAHCDDSLRAHLFRGEHAKQSDRAVTHHRDGRT